MKTTLCFLLALLLCACGGGEPAPIAQCNGAPKAAVVYVGPNPPVALAGVPDACVYTTDAATVAQLEPVVADAVAAAHVPRVYFVAEGNALPLDYLHAHPGSVDIASVWFAPPWSGSTGHSLASIYLNGGECESTAAGIRAQFEPALCAPAASFDAQVAIGQLSLGLIR